MKIASSLPFKAVLAAAAITTIGVIALNLLDTEVVDHGVPVPDHSEGCRLPIAEPAPAPLDVAPMPPASF